MLAMWLILRTTEKILVMIVNLISCLQSCWDLRVCREPHLYCVPLVSSPSMATRLTVNGQLVQDIGKTPGCCWVRVEQAAVGAPLLRAVASRKTNDARTTRATQKDMFQVHSLLNVCWIIICCAIVIISAILWYGIWSTFCACAYYTQQCPKTNQNENKLK